MALDNKRIGNIGLVTTGCNIHDEVIGEIVCYYPNTYYGRENDFNWSDDGEFATMNVDGISSYGVHKSCFKGKECCYVLAFIIKDSDEEPDIKTVGSRPFSLSENDYADYTEICKELYNNEIYEE